MTRAHSFLLTAHNPSCTVIFSCRANCPPLPRAINHARRKWKQLHAPWPATHKTPAGAANSQTNHPPATNPSTNLARPPAHIYCVLHTMPRSRARALSTNGHVGTHRIQNTCGAWRTCLGWLAGWLVVVVDRSTYVHYVGMINREVSPHNNRSLCAYAQVRDSHI